MRRTAAERQAEAALYRSRTEAVTGPIVPLKFCEYDKTRKVLKLASEFFAGSLPQKFWVESHHTGDMVQFGVVSEHDPLFDPDGWDGEQMVYRPLTPAPRVDHAVVYHQW